MAELEGRPLCAPKQSPAYRCLGPLLNALNWHGSPRHLCEIMPDRQTIADFSALRDVLGRLCYRTIPFESDPQYLSQEDLPALLTTPDEDIWVIIEIERPGQLKIFKGSQSRLDTSYSYNITGEIHLVRPDYEAELETEHERFGCITTLLEHEKKHVYELFGISFLVNGLTLALPVYILAAYDFAIADSSMLALIMLAGFAVIILLAEITLRELRARHIARIAARMHSRIMETIFERIVRRPLSFVENASFSRQTNKLKAFEQLGEIFGGILAVSLIDLLFIPIFIAASFMIGGWSGWLVTGFIAVQAMFWGILIPKHRLRFKKANAKRSETHNFRKEMTSNLAVIQYSAAEDIWEKRYSGYIARQLAAEANTQGLGFTEQTLAQTFSTMTVALIIGLGMTGVIAGELSIGSLVAIIVICWRVLPAIQAVLCNLNQLFQALGIAKQLDQLMQLTQETYRISMPPQRKIAGRIELENVTFSEHAQRPPALLNISMAIEPGMLVVLSGTRGASRTILLQLIANLYQPRKGLIRIDGFDARHFDIRHLRQRIAYVGNNQILFPGSLAYNFWLANPLADKQAIHKAIRDADLEEFVRELDEGLDTDLSNRLRSGLDTVIYQKIRLARAYIQAPAIYLLDEPVKDMDLTGHRAFVNKLLEIKGQRTAVIRTSDPDIYSLADKLVHLQAGQIVKLDINRHEAGAHTTDALRAFLKEEQEKEPESRPFQTASSGR